MNEVKLNWEGELIFNVEQEGHNFYIDVSKEAGGGDKGVRPKNLLLSSLGGCSGMDIVALLKKMRVTDYKFEIIIKAESEEEHPKVYKNIELAFHLTGADVPEDKAKRAIELTLTKYCPVYIMLEKAVPIKPRLYINDQEIEL